MAAQVRANLRDRVFHAALVPLIGEDLRKQRFSKQIFVNRCTFIGLTLNAYWKGLTMLFEPYKELPFVYRLLYFVFAGIPMVLIETALMCWVVLGLAVDPICYLIRGVPPPMTAKEEEETDKILKNWGPVLPRLAKALEENRKERFRKLGQRLRGSEEERP
jgi:hypothetical protein